MRLTYAALTELTLALAQYYYYVEDNPIMSDADYDSLEKKYKTYREGGNCCGMVDNVYTDVGSGETLHKWLEEYTKRNCSFWKQHENK